MGIDPGTSEDLRVSRIASLTLVNAMIFHQILAQRDSRVQSLARTILKPHVAEALADVWRVILEDIDYIPIFSLAREIVVELTGTPGLDDALQQLAASAMRMTGRQASTRHDLMGRIYHRLLADEKYFGAFYVEDLANAIDAVSETIATAPATPARLRTLLGIPEETGVTTSDEEED
jgi:hypothetical protein